MMPDFIRDILQPMNRQCGDQLPVSAFVGMEDGTFPSGTAAWEKRGIALEVPVWQPEGCTQCNQCAFICPHAAIRPALPNGEEQDAAPVGLLSKPAQGREGVSLPSGYLAAGLFRLRQLRGHLSFARQGVKNGSLLIAAARWRRSGTMRWR